MIRILKVTAIVFCFLLGNKLEASHILGADITYKLIDTVAGRYKFRVSLYRDCAGGIYGNEVLLIRTTQIQTSINLNFQYKEDVSNICTVPDVANNPITKCQDSNALPIPKGIERWVYDAEYTIGKNIGWAYVAWQACCRMSNTTCYGSGTQPILVSAVFNTNYINSSVVLTAPPIPNWNQKRYCSYHLGAIDTIDSEMVIVDNKAVVSDSIVYELYAPHTAEMNTNTYPTQFSSINYNSGLNAYNFLHTTYGIILDHKLGSISTVPSIMQDPVLAIAVKEYRAIPNSSGLGYTRKLIGYITRDIQYTVKDLSTPIHFSNYTTDTAKYIFNSSQTNVLRLCKQKNNLIKLNFTSPKNINLKVKDLTIIDKSNIENYNYTYSISQGSTMDTLQLRIQCDFKQVVAIQDFLFQLYYCSIIGDKEEYSYSFRIEKDSILIGFEKDTLNICLDENLVYLSLPLAEKVNWKLKNSINNSESVDSSWLILSALKSEWVYADNLITNSHCRVHDSIYLRVDTCVLVSGKVFLDSIRNCSFDADENLLKYADGYASCASENLHYLFKTNDSGSITLKMPVNKEYLFSIRNKWIGCDSQNLETKMYNITSMLNTVFIPVKLHTTPDSNHAGKLVHSDHQLRIYPNPASDYIIVSNPSSIVNKVELHNQLGQKTISFVENTNQGYRIDVRDLSEGIYLFQLRDKSGSVIKTEKLVISR
ncbi:MAG: T9SS type A sorting domain-containing protein [Sphingobacteriales bacterium]|jgi:hypothetical protein|nr:T9SS type A sorting domain-containing protein [Sphingobacteriales bacterium]